MNPDDVLIIEPLGKQHDRAAFSCGVQELDRYLKRQAGQDVRRRTARVFVCKAKSSNMVVGFYTLSALSLDLGSLPEHLTRKLPRHPIPAALIGRLAVDQSTRGLGIGRMLLTDAFKRTACAGEQIAVYAMVVDAKDRNARRFYEAFGFNSLRDQPMRLFLPLESIIV
jgi:ribosomal protein S18 acetylase RimI-like enzyme